MTPFKKLVTLVVLVSLSPAVGSAANLICPDNTDEIHRKEIVATSAPEVKVRASTQQDSKRWSELVRPLTQKAIKAAKAKRATAIQESIDRGCPSNQVFVAQYVPVPDRPSGCEHKIVTRPGEEGMIYVQVMAVCKYDWMCCTTELDALPAVSAPPAMPASVVQSSGAAAAPVNPKTK